MNYLDLYSNHIHSVQGLENLTQLTTLYLSSNQIQSIQGLENLTQLTTLSLYSNQIHSVQGLENLINLKSTLYLANNCIKEIYQFQFIKLSLLESININNNRITTIGHNAFNGRYLNLFKNDFISNITISSFNNIDSLRISYKSLILLRNHSHESFSVNTMDLSRNKIPTVYKHTIKGLFHYLNLKYNSIQMFEDEAFRNMPNLIEIDFSQNLIKKLDFQASFEYTLTNLTKLDLHMNEIKSITSHFFTKFPNLNQLDLSFNKLQSLKNTFFTYLNTLKVLNLSSNLILTIENNSFSNLASLEYLNLRNNLVYDLSGKLFKNLYYLSELNIGKNKIESISKEDFQGLFSIKVLDLSENMMNSLNNDTFCFVSSSIESLILKTNRIQTNGDVVYNLKRLHFLDLSFNNIDYLNLNSIYWISRLDLSNNKLLHVQNWNFLDYLTFLNLSRTNAELILNLNFSNFAKIKELDLSFNNLTSLPGNFLANLKNLTKLCLKETNLIQFEILNGLKRFEYIDLSNNKMLAESSTFKFQFSNRLKVLKMSNVSLSSFSNLEGVLISNKVVLNYLDVSSNKLTSFNYNSFNNNTGNINYLDISDNKFSFLFSYQVLIDDFFFMKV